MCRFGDSAPIADLYKKLGFTRKAVLDAARRQLARAEGARKDRTP
jgi:transketolase